MLNTTQILLQHIMGKIPHTQGQIKHRSPEDKPGQKCARHI